MCINIEVLYLAVFNQSRNAKTHNLFRPLLGCLGSARLWGRYFLDVEFEYPLNSNISEEGKKLKQERNIFNKYSLKQTPQSRI